MTYIGLIYSTITSSLYQYVLSTGYLSDAFMQSLYEMELHGF